MLVAQPLGAPRIARRVVYRERQVLAAADLRDEQEYLIGLRRRHAAGAHRWGIVHGLQVQSRHGAFHVAPGVAIDGFGRELVLAQAWDIPGNLLPTTPAEAAAVWLMYRERARVCVSIVDAAVRFDTRRPPGVTDTDLDLLPAGEPPDDPGRVWPVFLGRIILQDGNPVVDLVKRPYRPDRSYRPYAGLVGQTTTAASGTANMVVGQEIGAGMRRWSVGVADQPHHTLVDRLIIDEPGEVVVHGDLYVLTRRPIGDRVYASDVILEDHDCSKHVVDPCGLALRLLSGSDPVARYLRSRFTSTGESPHPVNPFEPLVRALTGASDVLAAPNLSAVVGGVVGDLIRSGMPTELHRLRDDLRQFGISLTPVTLAHLDPGRTSEDMPLGERWTRNTRILADLLRPHLNCTPGPWALRFRPYSATPTAALPWSIYRTDVKPTPAPGQPPPTTEPPPTHEMRFEIGNPGNKGDPTRFAMSIGYAEKITPHPAADTDATRFHPCFTVNAACGVTLAGDLHIEGDIIQAPLEPDPTDPRFVGSLTGGWAVGALGGLGPAPILSIGFVAGSSQTQHNQPWSYTIDIRNDGPGIVAFAAVYETVTIGGSSTTRPAATLGRIDPNSNMQVTINHADHLPNSTNTNIAIDVTVLGLGPAAAWTFASAKTTLSTT